MGDPDQRDDDVGEVTSGVLRVEYDWTAMSPSTAVIETVAAATGDDPTSIGPLYERVDPDALDAFIDPRESTVNDDTRLVSFEFAGKHVTVRASGDVAVQPVERPDSG